MDKQIINVVLYADRNYFVPLIVTIASALNAASDNTRLRFYVLYSDFSAADMQVIQEKCVGADIRWIRQNYALMQRSFQALGYRSLACYARLFVADLLPLDVSRAIMLDCDIVILSDLSELWDVNLDGAPVGACVNVGNPVCGMNDAGMFTRERICAEAPYFNSGVMVADLDVWRAQGASSRAIQLAKKYVGQFHYRDQCLLNVIFYNAWKQIHLAWNQQTFLFALPSYKYSIFSKTEYTEGLSNPRIVHFTTRHKPWGDRCYHDFAYVYHLHAARLGFSSRPIRSGVFRRFLLETDAQVYRIVSMWYRLRRMRASGFPGAKSYWGLVQIVLRNPIVAIPAVVFGLIGIVLFPRTSNPMVPAQPIPIRDLWRKAVAYFSQFVRRRVHIKT
jgi:lipopolysaccharide biosynthesis glycosyltransferase